MLSKGCMMQPPPGRAVMRETRYGVYDLSTYSNTVLSVYYCTSI